MFRIRMFLGFPDPRPHPLVRGTDPRIRIRIRIKKSRIRYAGLTSTPTNVVIRTSVRLNLWLSLVRFSCSSLACSLLRACWCVEYWFT